jgi:hypothetical protein
MLHWLDRCQPLLANFTVHILITTKEHVEHEANILENKSFLNHMVTRALHVHGYYIKVHALFAHTAEATMVESSRGIRIKLDSTLYIYGHNI